MTKIKLYGSEKCGPCKMVKPLLAKLGEVEYIDVHEFPDVAREAGVRAIPFYVNMENGKSGFGVKSMADLRVALDIPKDGDEGK